MPPLYEALLHGLAAQAGLDARALLASEELVIDGVVIVLSPAGSDLQCICEVGRLPAAPAPAVLQMLLQANTLGRPTRGATLGLSGDSVLLAMRIPLESPAALAVQACRDLAAISLLWGALLVQATAEALPPSA